MNTHIAIDKARFWALTTPSVAFYGALAANLADVMDPSIKTAATNGTIIRWNPTFVERLSAEEVRFVLLHETLHCAHLHFSRLPLDKRGNMAGDYAINRVLQDVAGIRAPAGALLDRAYDGLAEEEILAKLPQWRQCTQPKDSDDDQPQPQPKDGDDDNGSGVGDPQPQPQPQPQDGDGDQSQDGDGDGDGDGSGPASGEQPQDGDGSGPASGDQPQDTDVGGCGGFEAPSPTAAGKPAPSPEELKERWERNIVQAEMAAKSLGRGNVPTDMQRVLDRIKAPSEVDWRQETADFAKTALASRNDWSRGPRSRPNGHGKPVYPRRRPNDVGTIIAVRDTSGSISQEIANVFTAHIAQVMGDINCRCIVMDCDTAIHGEYPLDHGELPPLEAAGGGGTDFRAPFARAAEMIEAGEQIAGIVYLTDLDGTEPDESEVPVPTLWLSTSGRTATVGRTVPIEL